VRFGETALIALKSGAVKGRLSEIFERRLIGVWTI
jgi:hypothetical protein